LTEQQGSSVQRKRNEYIDLRRQYEPRTVKLAIVAESPPASGLYFYNPTGLVSEPLFLALMKQLHVTPKTKAEGLRAFQENGWVLVDATYEPVNKLTDAGRNGIIQRDYGLLREDLTTLMPDRRTPLTLIKTNVCRILEPKLVADGFNVLNRGRAIPFPSSGQQNAFSRIFATVVHEVRDSART
jgi:hypothetical protein